MILLLLFTQEREGKWMHPKVVDSILLLLLHFWCNKSILFMRGAAYSVFFIINCFYVTIAYVGEKKTCGCSQCTPSVFDLYLRCAAQAREGLLQWISSLEDFRRNSRYLVTLCQSAAPPIKVCYLWEDFLLLLLLLPRRSLAIIASWSFCC